MIKQLLLDSLPVGMKFLPLSLGEFHREHGAAFDAARLGEMSHDLLQLGCEHLWDFSVALERPPQAPPQTPVPGFARLFRHHNLHFFAEINQVISPQAPPMSCNVASGNEADAGLDWSLETTSAPPYPGASIRYALRRPRALWSRKPHLSPRELCHEHVRQREQIFGDLGLAPLEDLSIEIYCRRQQELCAAQREQAALASEVMLSWDVKFSGDKMFWWGDYARLFPRRLSTL